MKKIIINHSLSLILSLFIFVGCDDANFLKEKPETFYTIDNIFSTSEQVDQALIACYSHIRSMFIFNDDKITFQAFAGGNGTDMFDVASIWRESSFNDYGVITPSHDVFYINYSHWYQLISKANLALYGAELPQIIWANEEDKAYAIAQARFFRAFCYRNLGELYGGVPIVEEIYTTPRYDFVRTTRVETYQYAIDEMEDILNDLPETTAVAGRLVRGVAQYNLCQLYLDKGVALEEEGNSSDAQIAYQKAVSYGDILINGSVYSLMTERFGSRKNEHPDYYYANTENNQVPERLYLAAGYPLEGNVYWDLFQEGNQDYQLGNTEAIWVIQVDYTAYKTEDGDSRLGYSRNYSPVYRDPLSAHLNGQLEDVGGRGIVVVIPTMYTRDVIYEGKWENDMRNSEAVFRRTFLGNVESSEYFGKPVPWDVIYKEGESLDAVNTAVSQCFPVSCKIATDKYTGVNDGENRSNLFRDEYI
ncbi:MAG: RagB/SusD family nutrient uptake outer membrane protein [Tannerellaceae bacterium]|nr:RagB/SusD family nutrient uptake outer membrane protein [Tannerellaceae bacterium]